MNGALQTLADRLRRTIGLDESVLGERALALAVSARMAALAQTDLSLYLAQSALPEEMQRLIDEVTVPETWFFREPAAFAAMAEHATAHNCARSIATADTAPYRVLSAPCATGEEAYSIAMTLLGAGIARPEVLAIDVSAAAIAQARLAVCGPRAQRSAVVPARWREPLPGGGWRIAQEVSRCVQLRCANVLAPDFLADEAPFDAIFCRNLLIYLTPSARRQCLAALADRLRPGGLLFTGSAESAAAIDRRFVVAGPVEAFAFRIADPALPVRGGAGDGATQPVASPQPSPIRMDSRPIPPPASPAARNPAPGRPPLTPAALRAMACPPPALARAQALADQGLTVEAMAVCDALVVAGSLAPATFLLRGLLHKSQGRWQDARADLLRALALDPQLPAAPLHLSGLAERAGNAVRATGHRRRAADLRAKACA
jgi:chemotaxis protein methyltransferase WspC